MKKLAALLLLFIFGSGNILADAGISQEIKNSVIGSAYSESISYSLLQRICTEAGGRIGGSPQAKKALAILEENLDKYSIRYDTNNFRRNSFVRGDDHMRLLAPFNREIRGYAIGYSKPCEKTDGEIVVVRGGSDSSFSGINVKGKIILYRKDKNITVTRKDFLQKAADKGALAVLYSADKKGGMVLMPTANFEGKEAPITAMCITNEDGALFEEQIKNGLHPHMEIEVKSHTEEAVMTNLRAIFPGKSSKKVVLLAHYDSWDLGSSAIDNGTGTVVLADIARLIKKYSPNNYYTIECCWTDGEELGIFGGENLALRVGDSAVVAFNMDMPGSPNGLSTMGRNETEIRDFAKSFLNSLPGYNFTNGVNNSPWLGSDHQCFMIEGIPTFTFSGLPDDAVTHNYHDYGDTFDKANPKYLADAAAVFAVFGLDLANTPGWEKFRLSHEDTKQMLINNKLEEGLKNMGQWHD